MFTRVITTGLLVASLTAGSVVSAQAATPSVKSLPRLEQGSRGVYVLVLQAELNRKGYNVPGTGYFGSVTKSAVQTYQKKQHIDGRGIVGPVTWKSLSDCGVPNPTHYSTMSFRPGESLSEREANQLWTSTDILRSYFGWAQAPNSIRYRYDGVQVTTIKRLQSRIGLKPSGIVGPQTSKALSLITSTIAECGC